MPFRVFWSYILSLTKSKSNGTRLNDESLEPLIRRNEWEKIDIGFFTGKSESKELEQKQLRLQEIHSDEFESEGSEKPGKYSNLGLSEDANKDSEDSDEYSGKASDEDLDEDSELEGSKLNYPGRVPSLLRLMEHLYN